ncbi:MULTISPECIES: type IV pilus biogenesis/stability protein PilW [unclassified Acinetobacter]|uniref:type IV pilus biogenesis/stability protein PilW n=1 Tax=unclassified Acinetobacter TaxID=196816 RepID=UPI0035B9210B
MSSKHLKTVLSTLALSVTLTACVSTTPATKIGQTDPSKAVELRTQLAAELIRTGQLDRAKQELDEALRTNSRSVETNVMMGVLLQQAGGEANLKNAEAYFKRAVDIAPRNPQARNNYGTYLVLRQRYAEAVPHLQVAATTLGYEQRAAALENLGRTYLLRNQTELAQQTFLQVLDVNRDSIIARIELAELFYLQGRITDAGQMYEEYVRYTGQSAQGARALWIGARLARARQDDMSMKILVNQLRAQFPDSPEYQSYLKQQNNSEAVWK